MPERTRGTPFAQIPLHVLRDPTLLPIHKIVLCVIVSYDWEPRVGSKKKEIEGCYARIGVIARESACSERAARTALRDLEDHGLIERIERPGRASIYRVMPCVWSREDYAKRASLGGLTPARPAAPTPACGAAL